MSSFLCSARHVAVVALLAHAPGIVKPEVLQETIAKLRQLNDAALSARYGEKPSPLGRADIETAVTAAADWIRKASNADLYWILKGFSYQCAEAPDDYPGRAILSNTLSRVSALPGANRDSSVWSI